MLIGDYVTVAKAKNEQMKQISRFSLEELYDRQVEEGWESVWKQVQDSLHAARGNDGDRRAGADAQL